MWEPFFPWLVSAFGLFLGSFLNVVVFRLHTGEQFLKGRSRCPHCTHELTAAELVPLVSFVIQRGRCRSCGRAISWQYPLVEFATAAALGLAAWVFGPTREFAITGIATLFLIVMFVYDLKHKLILDVVSIPFAAFAFAAGLLLGNALVHLLLGAAIGGGVFLVQILLSKGRWVGGGDLKLGVGMGLLLGWERVLYALFLAYIIGAAVGAVLLLARKVNAKSAIPFGTFLALGTYLVLLWGDAFARFFDALA